MNTSNKPSFQGHKRKSFKDIQKQFKANEYYNSPNKFGEEGVDHININMHSQTHLGKVLDPSYLKTFGYEFIGKFPSVLNLWYWLRSEDLDDTIRRLTGSNLRTYGDGNGKPNYVPNFKAIIALATWKKLHAYPRLIAEIKDMDPNIKILSYNVIRSSGLRICSNYATLIIDIVNEIFKAIREEREPDFEQFIDAPNQAGLSYLEGVLSKILSAEKIEEMKNSRVPADEDVEDEHPELDAPDATEEIPQVDQTTDETQPTAEAA